MIYFLTHTQKSQQDSEQEVSETFSRANLIATTPKGVVWLIFGVVALALIAFTFGFANGKAPQNELEMMLRAMAKQEAIKAIEAARDNDKAPLDPTGRTLTPDTPSVDETKDPNKSGR